MLNDVQARNVATVERFYQSERDRNLPAWVALWRADGKQTFPTFGPEATVSGIDALEAVTREKFETRPPYGIAAEIDAFADPTKVLARLGLDFPGQSLVVIWCLFVFDEDGLVGEVLEMVDRGALTMSSEA